MDREELCREAQRVLRPMGLKGEGAAGHVACALEAWSGAVFTGICLDLPCSLGFCAEQAAAAQMLKAGETRIRRIVALREDGQILPPCGRCREFLSQLDEGNLETLIMVGRGREVTLRELLPCRWDEG